MLRLFVLALSLLNPALQAATPRHSQAFPPPSFRVAYVGDQGQDADGRAVLELMRDERTQLWVHLGDFNYKNDPEGWEALVNEVLGEDLPIFAVMGNHDQKAWPAYEEKLLKRLRRNPAADCRGEVGVKMTCVYRGITFVLSSVGIRGDGHDAFMDDALFQSSSPWKVCAWHKNQAAMQVGLKRNGTGWAAYETCRAHGAMVATAHEHSYARTHLLTSFLERGRVFSEEEEGSDLILRPGLSFAFVSGLGGKSIRPQFRGGKHWASVYTKTQGALPGVLFCDYNVDGDPRKARCHFKNIKGDVIDEFTIHSRL